MPAKNAPAEKPVITWTMVLIAAGAFSVLLASLFMQPPPRQRVPSRLIGQPLPKLEVQGWLNGPGPTAEELTGKVIVIDAWAFWCVPCRRAAPHLVALYKQYHEQGVVFIGLTSEGEENREMSEQFLEATRITWPQGYGAVAPLRALDAYSIPQLWVIDRSGRIVWDMTLDEPMEAAIERALQPPPTDTESAATRDGT